MATLDAIITAFNANYVQMSRTNAQLGLVPGSTTKFQALHKGKSVEFDVPADTSNMRLVGVTEDPARRLWRLVNV
jgi:hypothetical protein